MDITLVLTHRCNLACEYCYAGEHFRKEMDEKTMDKALDMLFIDHCSQAQLSFFGGEPFLAFPSMRRAVLGAKMRAQKAGKKLLLQCTTNGSLLGPEQIRFLVEHKVHTTVSLDGVKEAHDLNRPKAGGGSSFDDVSQGIRSLLNAGVLSEVMMVITPKTAPFVFRSVQWFWNEGIRRVRANLSLRDRWGIIERATLRQELTSVGRELLFHRLQENPVSFAPFDENRSSKTGATTACGEKKRVPKQIVVGSTGYLYPCAPMVGEDKDDGPEASLRLGHIQDDVNKLLARLQTDGAGCGTTRSCACASYLETGDRYQAGPNGLWFHRLCSGLGEAVVAALEAAQKHSSEKEQSAEIALFDVPKTQPRAGKIRSLFFGSIGLALLGGGLVSLLSPAPEEILRTAGAPIANPVDIQPSESVDIKIDEEVLPPGSVEFDELPTVLGEIKTVPEDRRIQGGIRAPIEDKITLEPLVEVNKEIKEEPPQAKTRGMILKPFSGEEK